MKFLRIALLLFLTLETSSTFSCVKPKTREQIEAENLAEEKEKYELTRKLIAQNERDEAEKRAAKSKPEPKKESKVKKEEKEIKEEKETKEALDKYEALKNEIIKNKWLHKILLESNVNIEQLVRNVNMEIYFETGITLLMLAVIKLPSNMIAYPKNMKDVEKLVQMLLDYGANPYLTIKKSFMTLESFNKKIIGMDATQLAAIFGYKRIVEMLTNHTKKSATFFFLNKVLGKQNPHNPATKKLGKAIQDGLPTDLFNNIMGFLETAPCKFKTMLNEHNIEKVIRLKNGNYAVRFINQTIKFFNRNFEILETIENQDATLGHLFSELANGEIASALDNGKIGIYDVHGKLVKELSCDKKIDLFIPLKDGNLAAISNNLDQTFSLIVFDYTSGAFSPIEGTGNVNFFMELEDSNIAIGLNNGEIAIWDQKVSKWSSIRGHTRRILNLMQLDSETIASMAEDEGTIKTWNYKKKQLVHTLNILRTSNYCNSIKLKNGDIAAIIEPNLIGILDYKTGKCIQNIVIPIRGEGVDPQNNYITRFIELADGNLAVHSNSHVYIFDTKTCQCLTTLAESSSILLPVKNQNLIIVENSIKIYDVLEPALDIPTTSKSDKLTKFKDTPPIEVIQDEKIIFDTPAIEHDQFSLYETIKMDDKKIFQLHTLKNGNLLYVSKDKNNDKANYELFIWNQSTKENILLTKTIDYLIPLFVELQNGNIVFISDPHDDAFKTISIFENGKIREIIKEDSRIFRLIELSNGNLLTYASNTIKIWDTTDYNCINEFKLAVLQISEMPNGLLVIDGCEAGVQILNIETGECLRTFRNSELETYDQKTGLAEIPFRCHLALKNGNLVFTFAEEDHFFHQCGLKLWNRKTNNIKTIYLPFFLNPSKLIELEDGKILLVSGSRLITIDLTSEDFKISDYEDTFFQFFLKNGNFVTSSYPNKFRIWDPKKLNNRFLKNDECITTLDGVNFCEFPGGQFFAIEDCSGNIQVWGPKIVKTDSTKGEIVKVTPKIETSKLVIPKVETPKVEAPKVETPKVEAPKVVPTESKEEKESEKVNVRTARAFWLDRIAKEAKMKAEQEAKKASK